MIVDVCLRYFEGAKVCQVVSCLCESAVSRFPGYRNRQLTIGRLGQQGGVYEGGIQGQTRSTSYDRWLVLHKVPQWCVAEGGEGDQNTESSFELDVGRVTRQRCAVQTQSEQERVFHLQTERNCYIS